jgi:flavin-dependent dehydrogenase
MIDLLIAGGGPAGLATAILARQAGLQVTVAEPRIAPIDKACGEGLMPPAVAGLHALGVDPEGHPLLGIRYLDARHSVDAMFKRGPGRGVRRTTLHAAMTERAKEIGVPIVAARISEFIDENRHIEAVGITARYLVAADGLHSPIRRMCGLDPRGAGGAAGSGPSARSGTGAGVRTAAGRNHGPRYGLRRHFRLEPWSDLVEVYWAGKSEAYVTPLADDLVGVAILGPPNGRFEDQLRAFPRLRERLAGAESTGRSRGAGPLRQDVRRRVADNGKIALVGDASGYVDALTGEGISVALAQAGALVDAIVKGRISDYEQGWRTVSRRSRLLTAGLLWARRQPLLSSRIVPAAHALPPVFAGMVNLIAG